VHQYQYLIPGPLVFAGGVTVTLLGESFNSVAHMQLAEVSVLWPFTVGAGKQPSLYKPYLSTLVKVSGCISF
jgi:hypothetical protein